MVLYQAKHYHDSSKIEKNYIDTSQIFTTNFYVYNQHDDEIVKHSLDFKSKENSKNKRFDD